MSPKYTILIADDEPGERYLVAQYLLKEGYEILEASDGIQALSIIEKGNIDLALIDIMMPALDGFEVVRAARRSSSVPIIFISARGEEISRVTGLELGADDYITKPFSTSELVARVRAQLRRSQGLLTESEEVLSYGPYKVLREQRRCYKGETLIELTRREFDLLITLVQNIGRVRSREQLLLAAWEDDYISPKTIDVHIASLRRKLGEELKISSLRGIGYRLEPVNV